MNTMMRSLKIKNKDFTTLKHSLLQKTGIDFESYRNQEMLDIIGELILFPKYALKAILLPLIVIALAIGVLTLLLLFTSQWLLGVVFFLVGEFLGMSNGLILGIIVFLKKISADLEKIVSLSFEQSQIVLRDMQAVKNKVTDKSLMLPSVIDVFSGVTYIIVLPGVTEVISKKVPLVGRIASTLVNLVFGKIFELLSGRLEDFKPQSSDTLLPDQSQGKIDSLYDRSIQAIEKVKGFATEAIQKAVQLAVFPFRLILLATSLISLGIIYIVFQVLM